MAKKARIETLYLTSDDATRIAFDVTGRGTPLMLLHGAGKTRKDWHKLGYVERLKDDFTVITVDVRGTGDSDFLTEISDYSIEKISQDILAVADACQVQRFAIWGFSFGGNIGRYLAAWSDRVAALAVIGVRLFGPAVGEAFDRYIDEFVEKYGPVADAYRAGRLEAKEKSSVIKGRIPVWVACLQAMRRWPSVEPGDLNCPAMLLVGTKNQNAMDWLQANQPVLEQTGTQVEIVENLTHSQEFTTIEQVFPLVRPFFQNEL